MLFYACMVSCVNRIYRPNADRTLLSSGLINRFSTPFANAFTLIEGKKKQADQNVMNNKQQLNIAIFIENSDECLYQG